MTNSLTKKRCVPCEGGVPTLTTDQVRELMGQVDGWRVSEDGKLIFKKLVFKNFVKSMEYLNRVTEVAEAEQHHPDLHLTSYRNVRIDITTHAIDGLSENDFILAAKLDALNPNTLSAS